LRSVFAAIYAEALFGSRSVSRFPSVAFSMSSVRSESLSANDQEASRAAVRIVREATEDH